MNTRQLQYAVQLAQTRNFSQVAEKLGISQPALSKQIISLEQELGVRLFDRQTPLSLTPAGEHFIREAQELLLRESRLQRAMEHYKTGDAGRITIGISPFRSLYLLPDVVRLLRLQYPGIQISLCEEVGEHLHAKAADGQFDFAVMNLPVDESLFEVTPLRAESLVLAVPAELAAQLPVAPGESIDLADCIDLPFVTLGPEQEMRQAFNRLCALSGIHPVIAAEVINLSTAWAMTRAGVGVSLLPLQFLRGAHLMDGICVFPLRQHIYSRQPAIVVRRGQFIPPYARHAIELLRTLDEQSGDVI